MSASVSSALAPTPMTIPTPAARAATTPLFASSRTTARSGATLIRRAAAR